MSRRAPAMLLAQGAAAREAGFFRAVYAAVRRIPRGRVATYGQIAVWLGVPRGARAVGWALRGLREPAVPWHRVVGAGGRISQRAGPGPVLQRRLLRREGVRFAKGCVDISRFGVVVPGPGAPRRSRRASGRRAAS